MEGGDYDQVVNAVFGNGAINLSGTTLALTRPESYTPSTTTVFRILNQAPASWGDEYNGWYKGFFSNVTDLSATPASFPAGQNWHWEFNWKNQAAFEFWDAYITTSVTPVPEPGTLVLLICGGLALLVWRRVTGKGTGPCFRPTSFSRNTLSRRKMDQSPADP